MLIKLMDKKKKKDGRVIKSETCISRIKESEQVGASQKGRKQLCMHHDCKYKNELPT